MRTATERNPLQLPMTPATTRASAHFALIPQTPFKCMRQSGWIKQPPIKFGGVKLADAADLGYFGISDYDDKVLNYKGVGGTISCRLIVRRTFQPSHTHVSLHVHSPFQFSGKEIKRLKVGPTTCLSADVFMSVIARL
jgi:hypothetical protein